ncbi:MAG: type III pantothenate kinase [Brachymonas sp.]|jgi:type III pantothenate kinase
MTFLAIDIGNTRLKWALYERGQPGAQPLAQGAEFIENIEGLAEGAWSHIAEPKTMLGCCVASDAVRRRAKEQIIERWDYLQPHWVHSSEQEAGLVNGYDNPNRLGSDRWIAMIAAWQRTRRQFPQNTPPLIVVMVGTAVTVEAIDHTGRFLGGLILPGHGIMLRALESGTAGLHVPTGQVREFPTNTSDALTSGGTFAIAGAVQRMHQHLKQRCGIEPVCLMTGGAGWKMQPFMGVPCELVENLIFDGLLEIVAARQADAAETTGAEREKTTLR